MAYLNDRINRKYYFTTGSTIIEISKYQDADGCGKAAGFKEDGTIKEDSELATIFPYIKLTYTDGEKYLWLQDFIQDGDTYNDTTFGCTKGLHGDDSETFVERYISRIKKEVSIKIKQGYSPEQLVKMYPQFLSKLPYEDYIDGKPINVTATTLSAAQMILSDDNIGKIYEDVAKEQATEAADRILKIIGKKVKMNDDKTTTLTFTIEDIESSEEANDGNG